MLTAPKVRLLLLILTVSGVLSGMRMTAQADSDTYSGTPDYVATTL